MLLQTHMTFFFLWNTKTDILNNIHAALIQFTIKTYGDQGLLKRIKKLTKITKPKTEI